MATTIRFLVAALRDSSSNEPNLMTFVGPRNSDYGSIIVGAWHRIEAREKADAGDVYSEPSWITRDRRTGRYMSLSIKEYRWRR